MDSGCVVPPSGCVVWPGYGDLLILILILVFLLPKSSLMSIENCNSLWLHKCESVVLLWGLWRSGVSLWKRVSVCLEMSTSAGKKAFNPLNTETPLPAGSHRGQLVPLSTNCFILSSCCSEPKNHAMIELKNPEWCSIDVHDLEILCCFEMFMSKY